MLPVEAVAPAAYATTLEPSRKNALKRETPAAWLPLRRRKYYATAAELATASITDSQFLHNEQLFAYRRGARIRAYHKVEDMSTHDFAISIKCTQRDPINSRVQLFYCTHELIGRAYRILWKL